MLRTGLLVLLGLTVLGGCSSTSALKYHAEPTPLKPGVSAYRLESVEVDLHNAENGPGLSGYASESQMEALFRDHLRKQLATQQVLAGDDESREDVYGLSVTLDYHRRFKWLVGWTLMNPAVGHDLVVRRNGDKIASHRLGGYTTDYGFLGNTLRQVKTLFFLTGPEDERQDIRRVSEVLAARVAEFGRRETDS